MRKNKSANHAIKRISDPGGNRTPNLSIWSRTRYHCATKSRIIKFEQMGGSENPTASHCKWIRARFPTNGSGVMGPMCGDGGGEEGERELVRGARRFAFITNGNNKALDVLKLSIDISGCI